MSNGEVERFKFINGVGNWSYEEAVLASDHDRIVAELKTETDRLKKEDAAMVNRLHEQSKIMAEKDARITKQKRVIEALKKQRDRKGCSYCEPPDDTRSDADEKEIAALEKEQS